MNRKGIYWTEPYDEELSSVQEHRLKYFGDKSNTFQGEADEAEWILDCILAYREDSRDFLIKIYKSEVRADEEHEWNSSFWVEKNFRETERTTVELSKKGRKGITLIKHFFEENDYLMYSFTENGEPYFDTSIVNAIELLEERVSRLESGKKRLKGLGNIPTNRAVAIELVWEALSPTGISMRMASRVIAEGFEMAGLETGSKAKRQESIYQTIRNLSL